MSASQRPPARKKSSDRPAVQPDQRPRPAEQLLRESEARYRRLLEQINEALAVVDERGRITLVNRQFCRMVGYSKAELVGSRYIMLLDPADRAIVRRQFAGRKQGKQTPYEIPFRRKDGGAVRTLVSPKPVFDAQGRFRGSISVVLDITQRKRAEDLLRESEARYRRLLEQMNEAVGVLDERGRFTLVNRRYCRMVGYSKAELVGSRYIMLLDPADRAIVRRQFAGRKQGKQTPYEVSFRRKDGGAVQGLVSPKPIFDAQGRFRGSFAVVMDITERKRVEEALRRNESLFRRLFEANVIGVIAGQNGLITQANGRFLKMVGYSRHDLKAGKVNWRKMTPRKYKPLDRKIVAEMMATGVVRPHEKEYIRKDGKRVPVQIGGALMSATPFRWVCFVTDLTERNKAQAALQMAQDKLEQRVAQRTDELARANQGLRRQVAQRRRAEDSLRESEEKYRQLFDMETDAIQLIDINTRRYLNVNDSACRLYGYTRREFQRLHMLDTVADRITSMRSALQVVEKKRLFIPYRLHKKKDGTTFPVEIFAVAFPVRGRTVLCAAVRDISVRVRAEQELHAAHAKLVSAREEERRRLALELHDSVGQKLIAAKLKLSGALAIPCPGAQRELSATLKELLDQIGELSTEVREVSRQLYPQTLEALGLPASLRQLAKDWGVEGPRIEVHCDASTGKRLPPDVEIALYRIAQEGLSNAIRHARPHRVLLDLSCARGTGRLSIIDNGRGFRVGRAASKGLGLDSMRERAESIGAKFELTSRPGQTCVEVSLPARAFSPSPKGEGRGEG